MHYVPSKVLKLIYWQNCITGVPRLLEAFSRVDASEGLLEGLVVDAREAIVIEVVASGDDEVDAHLLGCQPHRQTHTCTHVAKSFTHQNTFYSGRVVGALHAWGTYHF